MNRMICFVLGIIMILSVSACANTPQAPAPATATVEEKTEAPAPTEELTEMPTAEPTATDIPTEEPVPTEEPTAVPSEPKVLVIYFSAANTVPVDAVSGATPYHEGLGSVAWIAERIHERVGGDIAKIIPIVNYPVDYNSLADAAKAERDAGQRPGFTVDVNPEEYDVVFVGYPIWWYTLPMVMYNFFETYDFSGKTIIPFNTHAGSRDGGTYQSIVQWEPNATVLNGYNVGGESLANANDAIQQWLTSLGY